MFNKKNTVTCVFLVPFVLFTLTIDVFAQYGDFTRYIFLRKSERLIPLENGIDLSKQSLPRTIINKTIDFPSRPGTLRDIDFSNCDLHYSDLSETDFVNCSFRNANLGGVTALNSFFDGCDFTDAHITSSDILLSKEQLLTTGSFKRKDLIGYRLQGDFSGVDFSEFDLSGASFITNRGISSLNATLKDCDFSNAKISATAQVHSIPLKTIIGDRMTREQLLSTKCFRQRSVINVVFGGDLSEMDFSGMNLTGCHIGGNLHNADFTNAVITDCGFRFGSNNLTLDQIKSTWNYKIGNMAGVILPKELQEQLDAERQAKEKKP